MCGLQRRMGVAAAAQKGTRGDRTTHSRGSGAARAAAAIGVPGVCAQQDESAKFVWGNTGHADMLAALGAFGVDGGRETDGDCRGDSQQNAI